MSYVLGILKGDIHKGRPHQWGREVSQKRTHADVGVRGKCERPSAKCEIFEMNFINFDSQLSVTIYKQIIKPS